MKFDPDDGVRCTVYAPVNSSLPIEKIELVQLTDFYPKFLMRGSKNHKNNNVKIPFKIAKNIAEKLCRLA